MSLALRRFRLEGIGPNGARFDPLEVDLTSGADAARSAVLFLENGGGKSVLLRLLFAVVLPGRRQTVGGARLEGYVLTGDTGHVVLEWEVPDGGRLVTGLVLEWRGRQRSGTPTNLLPLWYSFVPRSGVLTFEELPTSEGGRRRTRSGFRERLTELSRADPRLQLVTEEQPGRWQEHLLRATPLDPEAFRYQRTMNADEADAESLFGGVRDDDSFVRFVIEAVHDNDEVDGFDQLVAGYAGQLARRGELEAEAAFAVAASAAMHGLFVAWGAEGEARRSVAATEADACRLRAGLDARYRASEAQAAAARAEAGEIDVLRAEVDGRAGRASAHGAELRRLEAEFLCAAAREALEDAEIDEQTARRGSAAWGLVTAVIDRSALTAEVARLREAQEAASRELVPLRQRAEIDEGRYVARLRTELEALLTAAEHARSRGLVADEEARRAAGQARSAVGEASTLAERRRNALAGVAAHGEAVAAARASGLVLAGEAGDAAARRHGEVEQSARSALARARANRVAANDRERALRAWLLDREKEHDSAVSERSRLGDELNRFVADASRLIDAERIQAAVPGAVDLWDVGDTVIGRLEFSILEASQRAQASEGEAVRLRAELEALGTDGLLPPSADVGDVLDALLRAGIGAATGFQHLAERMSGEERIEAIERNPGLAGGIVLADPDRLGDAHRALVAAGVESTGVVVLGGAEQLYEVSPGAPAPVRPAQYDPAWVERERVARTAALSRAEAALADALAALTTDEPLLSEVRDLLRRCPRVRRMDLVERIEVLVTEVEQSAAAANAARADHDAVTLQMARLDEAEPALAAAVEEAVARRLEADLLARGAVAALEATDAAVTLEEQQQAAMVRAEREEAVANSARAAAEAARVDAVKADEGAAELRVAIGQLPDAVIADPPDVTSSTSSLKALALASRATYEAERTGRDLSPQVEAAEGRLAEVGREVAAREPDVADEAERLAREPGATDPTTRSRRALHAARDVDAAAGRGRAAASAVGAAEQTLHDRTPSGDRQRHLVLEASEEPRTADEAAAKAAEQSSLFLRLTQEVRALEQRAGALADDSRRADVAMKLLTAAAATLPAVEADESAEPWPGDPDDAGEAARLERTRLDAARDALASAELVLERAERAVRNVAADPEHRRIGGLRVALAEEGVESLAPRAGGLAADLAAMRSSVQAELADIERHRAGLVLRLQTLVDQHLRQLARLKGLSTLPEGLGGWSRQPFLRIDFDRHEAAHVAARLEPVIDGAVASDRRRSGLDMILDGMRAAVVARSDRSPFRVTLLRPNRAMRDERATVQELEREFSGGMKLTAAICTYCALAALRAASRSTGGLFGTSPGPLFLDNPLGKASAEYLVDLQHRLAERLGVQLVHTTGVFDVEALGAYEKVVRLRNLADLRTHQQRLRVDPGFELAIGHGGDGSDHRVDATSFSRRRA